MNHYAIEILAFERHRSMLVDAGLRRRARRQLALRDFLPKMRWPLPFLTAARRIGLQQA